MITYEQLTAFVVVLFGLLGAIVLIGNAAKVIIEWYKEHKGPMSELETRVGFLEDRANRIDEKLQEDWKFRQDTLAFNKMLITSIKQLLQHEVDGNNISGLREMEREIDSYLNERAFDKG